MVSGDFSPAAQKSKAGGIVKAIFYFLWTGLVLWRPPTAPHTFPERSEILKNGSEFAEGMDAPASLGFLGLLHGILGTEALRKSAGKVEESPGWPLGSLPRTPVMLPSGSRPNGWNGPRGEVQLPSPRCSPRRTWIQQEEAALWALPPTPVPRRPAPWPMVDGTAR